MHAPALDTPMMIRLLHVVGTRPNFMKAAAVIAAADRWNQREDSARFEQLLVHTGQHYDEKMSRVFFDDLGLPRPDYDLEVGSGTHAEQTAKVMLALEPVLLKERPDLVLTVGDVNSTLAAALVAAKLGLPVAHVEAGLRSRDRSMPEELNRLVTDQLSDLLFTTSRDADDNLAAEGIPSERVRFVGNTMIDSMQAHLPRALAGTTVSDLGLTQGSYAVVTLHRPSNVDEGAGLRLLVQVLCEVSERLPVVFPVHARTRARLVQFGLHDRLNARSVLLTEPLGYLGLLGSHGQGASGAHRFRRHPGRDDGAGHPLPDSAQEHRETGDHHPGQQPARRPRRPDGHHRGGRERAGRSADRRRTPATGALGRARGRPHSRDHRRLGPVCTRIACSSLLFESFAKVPRTWRMVSVLTP